MGELQRPVQLGAFLALQRLHVENIAELLQTEWAMKVCACVFAHAVAHAAVLNAVCVSCQLWHCAHTAMCRVDCSS